MDLLYVVGDFNDILRFPTNRSRFNLEYMLNNEQLAIFRTGVSSASNKNSNYTYQNVPFIKGKNQFELQLIFKPIWNADNNEKLIIVEVEKTADEVPQEVIQVFEKKLMPTNKYKLSS